MGLCDSFASIESQQFWRCVFAIKLRRLPHLGWPFYRTRAGEGSVFHVIAANLEAHRIRLSREHHLLAPAFWFLFSEAV